jgi:hypothetical protein
MSMPPCSDQQSRKGGYIRHRYLSCEPKTQSLDILPSALTEGHFLSNEQAYLLKARFRARPVAQAPRLDFPHNRWGGCWIGAVIELSQCAGSVQRLSHCRLL